jgi:hypothetical protein
VLNQLKQSHSSYSPFVFPATATNAVHRAGSGQRHAGQRDASPNLGRRSQVKSFPPCKTSHTDEPLECLSSSTNQAQELPDSLPVPYANMVSLARVLAEPWQAITLRS